VRRQRWAGSHGDDNHWKYFFDNFHADMPQFDLKRSGSAAEPQIFLARDVFSPLASWAFQKRIAGHAHDT
jgi:hypothetical protein